MLHEHGQTFLDSHVGMRGKHAIADTKVIVLENNCNKDEHIEL